jgi:hypothetical protein
MLKIWMLVWKAWRVLWMVIMTKYQPRYMKMISSFGRVLYCKYKIISIPRLPIPFQGDFLFVDCMTIHSGRSKGKEYGITRCTIPKDSMMRR